MQAAAFSDNYSTDC